MATSGVKNTSNDRVKYKISMVQNSQDVANNRSNVTVKVNFYRTNTGYTTYGSGTVYCRINGTLYTADVTPSQKITNSGIDLFTKTLNIPHNADGTKTLSVSAWIKMNTPLTSNEQAYNFTLTTIPRASEPSCITWPEHTQNVGYFDDTIAIHMNRKSSNFTHTVRYRWSSSYGTKEGTCINEDTGKAATGVATGIKWKIPIDFMNVIPNSVSGTGTIYVDTYNGSTLIGTKTVKFTVKVKAEVIPNCSIQVLDATDIKDTYGNLAKGLSKLSIKVTGTGVYGSTISSYATTVGYSGVNEKTSYNGNEITTEILAHSGTVTVSATVKDSRGRTSSTATASFPVIDYEKPQITSLAVHRVDEAGVEDENGGYVKVDFSAKTSPLNNKNSAVYSLRYTNNTTGNVTTVPLTDIMGSYEVNGYTKIFEADGNSSYSVEIIVKDDISDISTGAAVSTAFSLYNCHESGTGWAFGKVAEEENTLENALVHKQIGNTYSFSSIGAASTDGYILMAQIEITATNSDSPIVFEFTQRKAMAPMKVNVLFEDTADLDPPLKSITYEGENYGAFLVKSAISIWNLYVKKVNSSDTITLNHWYTSYRQMKRIAIYFTGGIETEIPQGLVGYCRATPLKMQSLLDYIYPVNSIYISYSHVSPATLFGGTWERIKGAFLWAVDTDTRVIGAQGGEKTHTLTADEMPSHTHRVKVAQDITGSINLEEPTIAYRNTNTKTNYTGTIATEARGEGAAHNNMPPYIQVSVWRRTA